MSLPEIAEKAVQMLCIEAQEAYRDGDKEAWSTKKAEARDLLEDNGYTFLGMGDYRFVYALPSGETVLKIPRNKLGWKENQAEWENWDKATEKARDHMATIYADDFNGKWILQKRIPEDSCTREEADEVKEVFRQEGLSIGEIDHRNVGRDADGYLVAFDFAGA